MIRRPAGTVLAACALVALSGVAQAEVPSGPRLTFMEAGASGSRLISADPNGEDLGEPRTVKSEGSKTTFSPTELAVAKADGSGLTRLTHTRNLELLPNWDPSGQRLAYTLLSAGGGEAAFFGIGDSIREINADGTCDTEVLSVPDASLYGAVWQPGAGREAGPISC